MKGNILVFGGGPLQLSIIQRIKLAGFKAIVIDPDSNAPGKEIADVFEVVAGDDFQTTKRIALEYNVKGIVTAATDKPILMMCRIAEDMGLPFPSYNSCETLLNKAKFKEFLRENNLPHAKGEKHVGQVEIENLHFEFPVITKPVTNSGSRGVIKSNSKQELQFAINETLAHSKDGSFLIEEFIEGDEISVEALVQHGKIHILQLTDKIVTQPPYNVELGHMQPSRYNHLKLEIEQLLQKIVDKTGLDNCALHPELKINKDQLTVIEIGPRLGGDFITSHLVPLSTGVNIEDLLIQISIGLPISYKSKIRAAMVSYLNFEAEGSVKELITLSEIKQIFPCIVNFEFDIGLNVVIHQITNSLNRYGQFIIEGNNASELLIKEKEITRFLQNKIFNQ